MAPGDLGRDRLLAERASSLMWAGRIADAETACRLLLDRDLDPSLEGAVRVCLGHALLSAGRARDSLGELERACQSPLLTGAERAEAQAWASFARLDCWTSTVPQPPPGKPGRRRYRPAITPLRVSP